MKVTNNIILQFLLIICSLLLVLSCKKEKESSDYEIDLVVSNFKAESVRVILTDTLGKKIYYDRVIIDDDQNSNTNEVKNTFIVPKGIPKFLYKIRLEGPPNSLATVNLNHRLGGVSQGIGGVVTNDPNHEDYWVTGELQISVHLQ